MGSFSIFHWLILGGIVWGFFSIIMRFRQAELPFSICQSCGTQGQPKTIVKGSIGIEIILWLCFLIPGLIYSIWRLTTKYQACPTCGQTGMIPINSPNGRLLAEKFIR